MAYDEDALVFPAFGCRVFSYPRPTLFVPDAQQRDALPAVRQFDLGIRHIQPSCGTRLEMQLDFPVLVNCRWVLRAGRRVALAVWSPRERHPWMGSCSTQ